MSLDAASMIPAVGGAVAVPRVDPATCAQYVTTVADAECPWTWTVTWTAGNAPASLAPPAYAQSTWYYPGAVVTLPGSSAGWPGGGITAPTLPRAYALCTAGGQSNSTAAPAGLGDGVPDAANSSLVWSVRYAFRKGSTMYWASGSPMVGNQWIQLAPPGGVGQYALLADFADPSLVYVVGAPSVSTTYAGTSGLVLPQTSIVLASATGLSSGGGTVYIGGVPVAYGGVSTNTLTSCTGGTGILVAGQPVTYGGETCSVVVQATP